MLASTGVMLSFSLSTLNEVPIIILQGLETLKCVDKHKVVLLFYSNLSCDNFKLRCFKESTCNLVA